MTKVEGEMGTWRGLFSAVAAFAFVFLSWAPGLVDDLGSTEAGGITQRTATEPLPLPIDYSGWRRLEAGRRIAAGEVVYCFTIRIAGTPMRPPRPEDCVLGDPDDYSAS